MVTGAPRVLAQGAAGRAGVRIRTLGDIGELEALALLFATVWKSADGEVPISAQVLSALDLAGGYIAGAFDPSGQLIGGSVAFPTLTSPTALHSHITGVGGGRLGAGVGFALKLDQRAWALERGVGEVVWTFDPLVRRNAIFNLAKLGASVTGYLRNIYGTMSDVLNIGDESDRLLVSWRLDDPAATRALACGARLVVADDAAAAGPAVLHPGPGGEPVREEVRGKFLRVRVPRDIETMRGERPQLALDWRYALRGVLEPVLAAGGRILGLDAEDDFVVTGPAQGGER
jgi:predicted GNAT superfamily acetyltransferase